jgi:hypothetical protein
LRSRFAGRGLEKNQRLKIKNKNYKAKVKNVKNYRRSYLLKTRGIGGIINKVKNQK